MSRQVVGQYLGAYDSIQVTDAIFPYRLQEHCAIAQNKILHYCETSINQSLLLAELLSRRKSIKRCTVDQGEKGRLN